MKFIEKLLRKRNPESKVPPKVSRFDTLLPDLSDVEKLTDNQLRLRYALTVLNSGTYEQIPPLPNNFEYSPEEIRKSIEKDIAACLKLGATPDMIRRVVDPENTLYPQRWDLPIIKEVLGNFQSQTAKNR